MLLIMHILQDVKMAIEETYKILKFILQLQRSFFHRNNKILPVPPMFVLLDHSIRLLSTFAHFKKCQYFYAVSTCFEWRPKRGISPHFYYHKPWSSTAYSLLSTRHSPHMARIICATIYC